MNGPGKPIVLHSSPIWLSQTQTWIHSQVFELQKLGLDVHVACEQVENLEQFSVANIHCLADEPIWRQKWDKGLRKLGVRQHLEYLVRVGQDTRAQIVHSHFGHFGWANLDAVKKMGAKHVVTFYGLDVNKLPTEDPIWCDRYVQLFDQADLFLCEGSYMASCLVQLGCPQEKVNVQHLGVNVEQINFQPRSWQSGERLKVMIAASFREKKGIPYAILALGRLSQHIPIELTIIGDAGIEPEGLVEKEKIMDALLQTGLAANTRLLGYQPHTMMLREAYEHHVFLHPSVTALNGDTEGGAPVCIAEMLATGMPVVSTWHCDIPEVVGPSHQPFLAKERDVDDLGNCLTNLIGQADAWGELALEGRLRMESEYHRVHQAARLAQHYSELIHKPLSAY